uniref:Uncharacterized protein n=1 Tax=Ditylenchus dipsaci TaxID=166011 RepID=A0A915EMJ1_9BILA
MRWFGVLFYTRLDDPNNVCAKLADELVGTNNWTQLAYAPEARKLIVVIDPKLSRTSFEKIQPNGSNLLVIHPDGRFVRESY